MATYNSLYVLTRFSSYENAAAKKPEEHFKIFQNYVFRRIWSGTMRGKIKDVIMESKIGEEHHGSNWNGYGYRDRYNDYFVSSADGGKILAFLDGQKSMKKTARTWEQLRAAWARRLVRLLTDVQGYEWVDTDTAQSIADEKYNYKFRQIRKVEERQHEHYSARRESLIRKLKRENPLRRIEDTNHAIAIIQASRRHNNSDYEILLNEYREEAACGLIDKSEVKEMARRNMIYI